jgi:hypothetical protein
MPDITECYENKTGKRPRAVWGGVFAAAAILLAGMQAAYFFYNEKSGYEYIADWMLYAVNALIFIAIYFSVYFYTGVRKRALRTAGIPLGLLMCVNIVFMGLSGFKTDSVIAVSPDLHMMVLKQNPQTGEVTTYRNQHLIFARRYEQLAYTADGPLKTQWLTPDVCAVTYSDTGGDVRQYVGTFGDRASGPFYYTVTQAVRGRWSMDAKNADDRKITADETGITIMSGGQTEAYSYDDCVQFGTLAVVLCKDGVPRWTIALNQDCNVNSLRTLDDGCTITLCRVSTDKTAAFIYFRTYNPLAEAVAEMEAQQAGQTAAPTPTKMRRSAFPGLEKFDPVQGVFEIQTDFADPFEIGRAAFESDIKRRAVNGYDNDLQITYMTLLAGDINEFLIEIQSAGTVTNMGVSSKTEFSPIFRIKKGDGIFGAVRVSPTADGGEGLTPLDPPQVKDTSGDSAYHVFVAGEPVMPPGQEEEAHSGAQTLADILSADPGLSDFISQQGLVKVGTGSTDMFAVARLALEENLKMFAINGFDNDVQITRFVVFAGDINEFTIEIDYTSVVSQGDRRETAQYIPKFRIKKGDGVYLALENGYDAVGTAGLAGLNPPQQKDTSADPDYHFFVPAA